MQKLPEDVFAFFKIAYFAVSSNQLFEEVFKLNESIETIIDNINSILKETDFNTVQECHHNNDDIPQEIMQYINIAKLSIESNQTFEEFFKLGETVDAIIENIDRHLYSSDELVEEDYIVLTRSFTHRAKKYWIDESKNIYNDNHENIGTIA